ncbi:unnamed protein product [Tetraodon nigroviridis]|uniref:(spotted green pufferfish) hypothetical protein n=1 Tax=Tetraodon nigroviridis TaxID=99883 RepID=Q4RQM5_TETNG|nr:unnamed protein product [Tetraodon nigroviridis]
MASGVLLFVTVASLAASGNLVFGTRSFSIDYRNNCFLKDGKAFQYISGSIHYSRVPRDYWKDRLLKMYMTGLNAIQVYVPWNFHEAAEGAPNFTGDRDLEHFLHLANETGLLVILRPGPYICAEWEMVRERRLRGRRHGNHLRCSSSPGWSASMVTPEAKHHSPLSRHRYDVHPCSFFGCNINTVGASAPDYIQAVNNWFAALLPRMKPWLYVNGGNIISVQVKPSVSFYAFCILTSCLDRQVENEYGSYFACDYNYMRHLRTLFRLFLGEETVLFTTDGNTDKEMSCGTLEGLYATIDFGTDNNVTDAFRRQRRFEPQGPLVCAPARSDHVVNSEFYTGWLDHWGDQHAAVDPRKVSRVLEDMLVMGASINMYMFEGGTNFGYWNGADLDTRFRSVVTSYDYDAPLNEAGDPTEKLFAIRNVIKQFRDIPAGPMPPPTPKFAYGLVQMRKVGAMSSLIKTLCPAGPVTSQHPLTFEQMKQYYGYMLYRTTLPRDLSQPTPLLSPLNGVHDRAYVSINGVYQGLLERDTALVINITGRQGDAADILVENMGRVNFGSKINDHKGLVSDLILGEDVLTDWKIYPLNIDGVISEGWPHSDSQRLHRPHQEPSEGPGFYTGTLQPNGLARDTFLKLSGWTKVGLNQTMGLFD